MASSRRDSSTSQSLTTLQRALRRAPDGLPWVSTHTIWCVVHEAGLSWQRDRSWCHTGLSKPRRKRGGVVFEVEVEDPDAAAKKLGRQTFRVEEAFSSGQIGGRVTPELALESAGCLALNELLAQSTPLRQILGLQLGGAKGMVLVGGGDQSDAATRQEHGCGYLTAARAPLVIPR